MNEVWLSIPEHPGYEVSDNGRVRSLDRVTVRCGVPVRRKGRVLKPQGSFKTYYRVSLGYPQSQFLIHRIVAEAFVGNPDNKPFVNHKDGNRLNNEARNLEWVTQQENMQHAYATGLIGELRPVRGSANTNSKLSKEECAAIKQLSEQGVPQRAIARQFDVSQRTVLRVVKGMRYLE